jgi:hypothetical protein
MMPSGHAKKLPKELKKKRRFGERKYLMKKAINGKQIIKMNLYD